MMCFVLLEREKEINNSFPRMAIELAITAFTRTVRWPHDISRLVNGIINYICGAIEKCL